MTNGMTDNNAIIDLCLRNALRYARGEIRYTMDLDAQLRYAYKNANANTRHFMKQVFKIIEFTDKP